MKQEVDSGEILSYRKLGTDKADRTVVLVHGNFIGQHSWDPFLPFLQECNLYTLDMRGFGDSSYKKPITSINDFSSDLLSFCNRLKLKKVDLIGWSMGGPICMAAAIIAPALIRSITLLSSVGTQGLSLPSKSGEAIKDPTEIKNRVNKFNSFIKDPRNKKQVYDSLINGMLIPSNNICPKQFDDILYEDILKLRNYLDVIPVLLSLDMKSSVSKIECPILMAHGTNDAVVPFKDAKQTEEILRQTHSNIQLIPFLECSHSLQYEVPQQLAKNILSFINQEMPTKQSPKL